ncbi:mechanosensitive ion channel domain-containing protein [Mangrovibrevibacter kandeliae]|uniref:mechanosensitive ion channel domain-containing protein n=1 Tax=Mangrovibrevibacter kandeliae TaxID=2968473 RepID=UPI002118371A|nr:mechanosensitive ion channel domain-containing protein [Aurantimonas sp. CSK15Z-1]MCQ8781772.1 mechanosensitive ion channel [Aurantimonas sp. CSK15Z-1]
MRQVTTGAILALLCLLLFNAPALAQVPGLPSLPAASDGTKETDTAAGKEPSLDDLIGILENDDSRAKLIESLKAAAYKAPAADAPGTPAPAQATPNHNLMQTVPGQLAGYSRAVVGWLLMTWQQVERTFTESVDTLAGAGRINLPRILEAILPVVLVAIVVFVVLGSTRYAKTRIYDRLAHRAVTSGPFRKLFLLVVSGLVDALSIVLGWAGGYVVAAVVNSGRPSLTQALFLNAFLAIELVKVALAAFVSPRYPQLRLTPFSDRQASYWYFWLSRLISVLGYTFLFLAPVVQDNSSAAAAGAVKFLVALLSLATILALILKNRRRVEERLGRRYVAGSRTFSTRFNYLLGKVWWLLAAVYVLALFSAWLTSPTTTLPFLLAASGKSVLAMAVGGLVVTILSRLIVRGVPVPDTVKERLPLLERRVNSFIPNALTVIRVLVVVAVLAVILDAWELLNLRSWMAAQAGQRIVGGIVGAGTVAILGFAVFLMVSSWVEYRLNPNFGTVPTARERTLLSLFRNAFTITLAVIVVMLVLSQLGIDIGPLLAGAGVVGLAVGFGAQKLVQDIITGAFIQLENAMNEGDVVTVASISGVVERLTIRSVGLRALDGTYHLIPFSSVDSVSNMTKDFSQFVADLGVAYRENTDDAKQVMRDAFDLLQSGEHGPEIIGDFEMFGVNELGDSAVTVRGRIKTLPGKQWGIGRAYNEIVKKLCDERGIEIPFPHMTVWFGENKGGGAPPLHVDARARTESVAPRLEARPETPAPAHVVDRSRHGSVNSDGSPIPPDNDGEDGDGRG